MPIHDWTRVEAGIFRHFHNEWYASLSNTMNERLLPEEYYALIEQTTGDICTDVLTLRAPTENGHPDGGQYHSGSPIAVATLPPQVKTKVALPRDYSVPPDKQLVIRHVTGDRVVAIIEIVSAGNKSSADELLRFVVKAGEAIRQGVHLLVIDVHPPTGRDPQGIHGALSAQMGDHSYEAPADKPLTLVSYVAMPFGTAYVEPVAVGDVLIPMPLFLDEGHYVNVPLEETYMTAFNGVPRRWKPAIEKSLEFIKRN
jgi:Protein of unknown function (DUF4058)